MLCVIFGDLFHFLLHQDSSTFVWLLCNSSVDSFALLLMSIWVVSQFCCYEYSHVSPTVHMELFSWVCVWGWICKLMGYLTSFSEMMAPVGLPLGTHGQFCEFQRCFQSTDIHFSTEYSWLPTFNFPAHLFHYDFNVLVFLFKDRFPKCTTQCLRRAQAMLLFLFCFTFLDTNPFILPCHYVGFI